MKIQKAITEEEIQNNFLFFKKMWKELFNIDFEKNIEKRLESFRNDNVYFISDGEKIISSSQIEVFNKWRSLTNWKLIEETSYVLGRLWTLEEYRWKWLWWKLIKNFIKISKEENIKELYIPSELWNVKYYSRFWFEAFWKSVKLWNSEYIYMKYINK